MLIEFDETRETGGDVITRLQEVDRIFARMHAVQANLLTEAAGVKPQIDEYLLLDAWTDEQRRILIEDAARDELACALRRSSRVMQDMIDLARVLVGLVPEVLAALKAGRISLPHARLLADAAERLPAGTVEEFVARVLPVACRGTLAATRKAVKRAVGELDGEGETRRREQAKCMRDVWVTPDADGMSLLIARMTTEMACALKVQIDADGFDRAFSVDAKAGLTNGEHRVEALAALILGGEGRRTAPKTAHVNLTIDLPTFVGLRDGLANGSAELTGAGPVPAAVVRDLLQDPDTAVTIRRLVTDPVTGHLLDYGRKTYDIPPRLRDYIIARDRLCRFPGCNRRADLSQIDHAVAWDDGGETKPGNLGPLCTRHHQLKTHGGWEITESRPDGSCVWRSPQGRTYESGGPEPLPELPDEN